ncbi:MAG: hypothetical protein CMH56_03700 [Myxococcales bacterium]|nr:hypothetical protein [Myxococcales bacterium]
MNDQASYNTSQEGPKGKGLSRKLQLLGKNSVSTLYMLVRNARMYAPDNEIFAQPLDNLCADINAIISSAGQYALKAVNTSVYLNNEQLQLDFSSMDNVRYLTEQFKERDVGGFTLTRPIKISELRDFVWMFSPSNDGSSSGEDGMEGHRLTNIKVGKYGKILEQLENMEDAALEAQQNVDRKKYALTVYARAIYFMRKFLEALRNKGNLPNFQTASRLVQDFVDIASENRSHFLGLTTTKSIEEYQEYHSVNTCLISVIFGQELKMSREQLHQLGMSALFHNVGMVEVSQIILNQEGPLTAEQRRQIDLFPLHTVKTLLSGRGLDQETVQRVVAAYESKVDYSRPMKKADGEVQLLTPKVELSLFGRMIAIASVYDALTSARPFREAYGPELAMCLMIHDLKYKFDPFLLKVFMKVMAIQPVQVMEGEHTIQLG